ncbi:MAG TPA: biotin carboxylase N-terminal domain-containing protein [bacterium]|nr:biotin carboxylase N-terminal domain-containing protein [bacterium]
MPAPAGGARVRDGIHRVLVANRGEIAVRIIRACRELGFETVAVASDADLESRHARLADRLERLGPADPAESYLHQGRVIDAARRSGADTIHPGYGFLAESAAFAEAAAAAGLRFVGPPASVIARLGDKTSARTLAEQAGVSPVPGAVAAGAPGDPAALAAAAGGVGFPLLVKAAAGGGGRGMRLVERAADLPAALASGEREARAAFGDGRLFLERRLDDVRHVEVQILADAAGHIAALGERECSIQRRHQKLIEEAPSPRVEAALRRELAGAAIAVARAAGYVNAGTVEFLLAPDGRFYFLEVNTRLQVEHPVTELTTGVDLVKAQFRLAAGDTLEAAAIGARGAGPRGARDVPPSPWGHAIECRVCAEDPADGFRPSPGPILVLDEPSGPGVRVDSGVRDGWTVPAAYDSLLAKVIVWDRTRAEAIARMDRALAQYVILGCGTNLAFLRDLIRHDAFARGETATDFLERHFPRWQPRPSVRLLAAAAALAAAHPAAPVRAAGDPARGALEAGGPPRWDPWDSASGWRIGGPRG